MIENSKSPAFPDEKNYGLTKREYFAGLALQGILANSYWIESSKSIHPENISDLAIRISDRLLKQLNNVDKLL